MATTKISKKQLPSDTVYTSSLNDSIAAHNVSPSAHQDIRNTLNTASLLPTYNSTNHKINFTTIGGNTYEIDLPLEGVVDSVTYDSSTKIITVHKLNDSSTTIDLSSLDVTYTGGSTLEATVSIDANNVITASINQIAASKISYNNSSSGLDATTVQAAIDEVANEKVDKVTGKQLSTEDFTTNEKTKLAGIAEGAEANVNADWNANSGDAEILNKPTTIAGFGITDAYTKTEMDTALGNKVDKVTGKGLSTNDYTDADKAIVDGVTTALDNKVDKVSGKGLSTNDYTNEDKAIVDGVTTALDNKVDKVAGKGLSDENFTTAEKNKLSGIESGAEENIIEIIKVNDTALIPDVNKAVNITIPAAAEYTIEEITATTGYAKSYQLKKDNTYVGDKIDIPKDLVIESGEIKVVDTPDVPYIGAQIGDKYIDITLNDPSADHIYIPVNDLVDAYSAGNGIEISNANAISAKLDSSNSNGLSIGASGIALAVATTSAAGAMSAADKTKLEGVESGAEANVLEEIKVNGITQTITNKAVDITVPTKTSDLTNDSNFVSDANYIHTDNNFTTILKDKIDSVETNAEENVIESIEVNGVAATVDANKKASVTIETGAIDTISLNSTPLTIDANKNVDIPLVTTSADGAMSSTDKTKLDGIAAGADENVIETVKVNGTALTPDSNKAVDVTVPTKVSDLTNDSEFITKDVNNLTYYYTKTEVDSKEDTKQDIFQYTTMLTASSTNEGKIIQYVGDTTLVEPIYTNGCFYKCEEDSENPGTYIWNNVDTIELDDFVRADEVVGGDTYTGITITPGPGSVTEQMLDVNVVNKLNIVGVETYSGTTDPSSSLGKDGDIYFLID